MKTLITKTSSCIHSKSFTAFERLLIIFIPTATFFGHLIPFLIVSFLSFYYVLIEIVKLGVSTRIINFIGNFHPIILQRHHRMRIEIIRKR